MTLYVLGLLAYCRINCLVDKYLPVFLSIEDTINLDQIPKLICWNTGPKLQGTSTMVYCSLQTFIIVPLFSPPENKLPSVTAKYFTFWPISVDLLLPFFYTTVSIFSCIVEAAQLCFHVEGMAFWLQFFHEDHFWPDFSEQYMVAHESN